MIENLSLLPDFLLPKGFLRENLKPKIFYKRTIFRETPKIIERNPKHKIPITDIKHKMEKKILNP